VSIVLYRVDERLIHGQVVVGWGATLNPQRIVVVDDELAASEWEQELYTLGLPAHLACDFLSVEDAHERLPALVQGSDRVILLTRDIRTMQRLAQNGCMKGAEVNIGGIHAAPGRRPILPYVYLSDDEQKELRSLATSGVTVSARDLPNGKRVDVEQLMFVERRA
jgi:PTS system mannose-specific IIB component/fructoselysine and glucoselysine-specific PTS system IIB component